MPLKFLFGRIVITRSALEALYPEDVRTCLGRHGSGDWGELDPDDKEANEYALEHGARLLSCYQDRRGASFWIITEADRSATTVLLHSDY